MGYTQSCYQRMIVMLGQGSSYDESFRNLDDIAKDILSRADDKRADDWGITLLLKSLIEKDDMASSAQEYYLSMTHILDAFDKNVPSGKGPNDAHDVFGDLIPTLELYHTHSAAPHTLVGMTKALETTLEKLNTNLNMDYLSITIKSMFKDSKVFDIESVAGAACDVHLLSYQDGNFLFKVGDIASAYIKASENEGELDDVVEVTKKTVEHLKEFRIPLRELPETISSLPHTAKLMAQLERNKKYEKAHSKNWLVRKTLEYRAEADYENNSGPYSVLELYNALIDFSNLDRKLLRDFKTRIQS